MKGSLLVLLGIAVGCAAGAAGLGPAVSVGQTNAVGGTRSVAQYCTDTGDFNNTEALDAIVRQAGTDGWELVTVARPTQIGATHKDYVCFRRFR